MLFFSWVNVKREIVEKQIVAMEAKLLTKDTNLQISTCHINPTSKS